LKRPWNRVDDQVYSLVTIDSDFEFNYNIMTYVSPVSMKPKVYVLALDPKTKTFLNFLSTGKGVLQMLSRKQTKHVSLLGKQSGAKTNKFKKLEEAQLLKTWKGFKCFQDANAWIEMECIDAFGQTHDGDHELFLCKALSFKNLSDKPMLTNQWLIKKGIIL